MSIDNVLTIHFWAQIKDSVRSSSRFLNSAQAYDIYSIFSIQKYTCIYIYLSIYKITQEIMANPFQKNSDQMSKNMFTNPPNSNNSSTNIFKQGSSTPNNTNPFQKSPINPQQPKNTNPQNSSNPPPNISKGNVLNQPTTPNQLFGKNISDSKQQPSNPFKSNTQQSNSQNTQQSSQNNSKDNQQGTTQQTANNFFNKNSQNPQNPQNIQNHQNPQNSQNPPKTANIFDKNKQKSSQNETKNPFDKTTQQSSDQTSQEPKKEGNGLFNQNKDSQKPTSNLFNQNSGNEKKEDDSKKSQQPSNNLFTNQKSDCNPNSNPNSNQNDSKEAEQYEGTKLTLNETLSEWKGFLDDSYKEVKVSYEKCMQMFDTRKQNKRISNTLKVLRNSLRINKQSVYGQIKKMEDTQNQIHSLIEKFQMELGEQQNNSLIIHPLASHFKDIKKLKGDITSLQFQEKESSIRPEENQMIKIFELLRFVEDQILKLNRTIDCYLNN